MIFRIIILLIFPFSSVFTQTNQWRIIWDQNSETDISHYIVFRDTISSPTLLVGNVIYPDTVYTDTQIERGKLYYYWVKAVNDSGIMSMFSAPDVAAIPLIKLSDLTLPAGSTITFDLDDAVYVKDPDHSFNELVWSVSGGTDINVSINPLNHTATVITPLDTTIQELFTFSVVDPNSFFDAKSVTISLSSEQLPAQAPLVGDIPDQTIFRGQSFTLFDLDKYVTDADNDISELIWTVSGNNVLSVQIDSLTHIVRVTTADTNWTGNEFIKFMAADPTGLYDEDGAMFSINQPGNTPPEFISVPKTTTMAGDLYSYAVSAYDPDSDPLVFQLDINSPAFLDTSFINDTSAYIFGTPTLNDTGTYNVTIQVSDGKGGLATQQYELIIILSPIEHISEINAYPIPYVLSKSIVKYITFRNAPIGSEIAIYNLLGEPVFRAAVTTEPFLWYINNNSGADVLSGLYIYSIKDGSDKMLQSGKLVIIR